MFPQRVLRKVLALAFCAAACLATSSRPARAAGLLIADGGLGGVLTIESHEVEVTVDNGVAVTKVAQVFRNTENRVVEALYTFPVPKNASVAGFSMWIGGQEMVGEVVEKEKARQIYDSYKQVNRDPGLLEQVDYKTFELRIFPIPAGAEQRIEISYYQELDFDAEWATWVYPLATVSKPGLDSRTQGRFALSFSARSEVPITELASPSHPADFAIAKRGSHGIEASLETAGGDLGRDLVIAFKAERAKTGLDLIASKPPGEDGFFQLSLTAGDELEGKAAATDYLFLLDISGSMNDDGKLTQSRGSLGSFIDGLSAEDRFEVLAFNIDPRPLFGQLEAADRGNQARAADFLASQRAGGGTQLKPALETAWRYHDPSRPLVLVLLSDGMTEQRERAELLRLLAARPAGVRFFAIGVGNEINKPLLEQLAHQAGGFAAFVSAGDDFDRQAQAFRRKLSRPAASSPKIRFEGGGTYDLEPAQLPDLYHGSPLRLYGRYREAGPATVVLSAEVGGRPIEKRIPIEFPSQEGDHPEIERMWATKKVDRLAKEADAVKNQDGGSRDGATVAEIVRLGEAYSIVTEHTSFLVLENDGEYQRWKIERRNALRLGRDREAQARRGGELERLREKARAELGPRPFEKVARDLREALPGGPARGPRPASNPGRGFDVDLGGGSSSSSSSGGGGGNGGGAIDARSAVLMILLAAFLFLRRPS
jgi:Ca-activated chloride channel family protein